MARGRRVPGRVCVHPGVRASRHCWVLRPLGVTGGKPKAEEVQASASVVSTRNAELSSLVRYEGASYPPSIVCQSPSTKPVKGVGLGSYRDPPHSLMLQLPEPLDDPRRLSMASIGSTPASDSFYTATSFLSPGLTSPVSPLPMDPKGAPPQGPATTPSTHRPSEGAALQGVNLEVPRRLEDQRTEDLPCDINTSPIGMPDDAAAEHLLQAGLLTSPGVMSTATSTPIRKGAALPRQRDLLVPKPTPKYRPEGSSGASFEVLSAESNYFSGGSNTPEASRASKDAPRNNNNNNNNINNIERKESMGAWHSHVEEVERSYVIDANDEIEKANHILRKLREPGVHDASLENQVIVFHHV